jgi:hypothetical protein
MHLPSLLQWPPTLCGQAVWERVSELAIVRNKLECVSLEGLARLV